MKPILRLCLVLFSLSSLSIGQTHPYLYFGSSDIVDIRTRTITPNTPAFQIWNTTIESQINYYRTGNNINLLATSFWDHENLYAFALAYVLKTPLDPSYLSDIKTVLWGGTNVPVGLLYQPPEDGWKGAHRVVALSMVYDLLYYSFNDTELTAIRSCMMAQINTVLRPFVLDSLSTQIGNNTYAIPACALGIAAMALNGQECYPQSQSDLAYVKDHILLAQDSYLNRIYSDGACHEGVGYGFVGLNGVLPFIKMLSRWQSVNYMENPTIKAHLQDVPKWLAYELLPESRTNINGYFNTINDTWTMDNDITRIELLNLLVLSGAYQDGVASWLFDNTVHDIGILEQPTGIGNQMFFTPSIFLAFMAYDGVQTVNPGSVLPKASLFPERGLAYVRTSTNWADANDIQFGIEGHQVLNPITGYYSGIHNHSDKNHFVLNAFGESYAVDLGARIPEDHNYVLVDNKGQAVNPAETPQNNPKNLWALVGATDLTMLNSAGCSFIHGDAKKAFNNLVASDGSQPGGYSIKDASDPDYAGFLNPVENADRFVIFNQLEGYVPPYLIICDDINKNNSTHQYQWLFHSSFSVQSGWPALMAGNNGSLRIWFVAAGTPNLSSYQDWAYRHSITTSAVNPYFHVLIYPSSGGVSPIPTVTSETTTNGSCLKATWSGSGTIDFSILRYGNGTVSSNGIISDAKLTQLRKSNSGYVESFVMGEGTHLTDGGVLLADLYGTSGTVLHNGTTVTISGPGISSFRVYAPTTSSVILNAAPVQFVQNGDYVESSGGTPVTNLLTNGDFEDGTSSWNFYTNGTGSFATDAAGPASAHAAHLTMSTVGSNMQLYQADISLEAGQTYRLTFNGKCSSGHDVAASICKHGSPYTNYGLSGQEFDLGTSWGSQTAEFTASGFSGTATDARLMFWFPPYAANGDQYYFDDLVLERVTAGEPVVTTDAASNVTNTSAHLNGRVNPNGYSTSYYFQYKKSGDWNSTTSHSAGSGTSTVSVSDSLTGLDSASVYHVRLVATNSNGTTTGSEVTFTAGGGGSVVNLLVNGGFENGTSSWNFYTNGEGGFADDVAGPTSDHAAHLTLLSVGSNMQLYQADISLEAGATYRLSYNGKSTAGRDVAVSIFKHGSPYTNYGLSGYEFDLGTSWGQQTAEFTASGFSGSVSDARLMFWFPPYATDMDQYYFDDVILQNLSGIPKLGQNLQKELQVPKETKLIGNFPNPFNPSTVVRFGLSQKAYVTLTVYNTLGQRVAQLVEGEQEAGYHEVRFDANNLASGVYFCRLVAGPYVETKKLSFVR